MDRRSGNFGELGSFKSAVKREKERSLPSFEGVDVLLEDAESGVEFSVPVCLIGDMWTIKSKDPLGPVTKIRLSTGEVHFVKGDTSSVMSKINEAKIKGGHN